MTEQELNKKYKDLPPREEMTQEQERELVSDLFDMYEQEGFASVFWSQGSDYQQYHGQPFTVLGYDGRFRGAAHVEHPVYRRL